MANYPPKGQLGAYNGPFDAGIGPYEQKRHEMRLAQREYVARATPLGTLVAARTNMKEALAWDMDLRVQADAVAQAIAQGRVDMVKSIATQIVEHGAIETVSPEPDGSPSLPLPAPPEL